VTIFIERFEEKRGQKNFNVLLVTEVTSQSSITAKEKCGLLPIL
jgi:hypothetical protein